MGRQDLPGQAITQTSATSGTTMTQTAANTTPRSYQNIYIYNFVLYSILRLRSFSSPTHWYIRWCTVLLEPAPHRTGTGNVPLPQFQRLFSLTLNPDFYPTTSAHPVPVLSTDIHRIEILQRYYGSHGVTVVMILTSLNPRNLTPG